MATLAIEHDNTRNIWSPTAVHFSQVSLRVAKHVYNWKLFCCSNTNFVTAHLGAYSITGRFSSGSAHIPNLKTEVLFNILVHVV